MYNHQIMQHPNPVPEGDNQTFLKFIHNHSWLVRVLLLYNKAKTIYFMI